MSALARRRRAGRPGWVVSLAAVTGVVVVVAALTASGVIHGTGTSRPASPAHDPVVYVPDNASGTVTPIRTATNTALTPAKAGLLPMNVAVTPDGKTAYVANFKSGTVTPIRTATNTALAPVKVGGEPQSIAIASSGRSMPSRG